MAAAALIARDRTLLSAALTCFARAVFRWHLRPIDRDDDDDNGTGAQLANAARSPMGTLPFARMPPPPARRLTASVDDFTLHADTAVAARDRDRDRDRLERLCRYGAHPPFPHRRLRLTPSGHVVYNARSS